MYYRLKFRALKSGRVTEPPNYYKHAPLKLEFQIDSIELAFKAVGKNQKGAEGQLTKSNLLLE